MKKNIMLPLLTAAALLVFTNFKCEKENTSNKLSGCVKGKVVKGFCSQNVIQVLSGDTANVPVAAVWNDPDTGNSYTNVFTVKNYCSFAAPAVGEEFWFYVTKENKTMDCIICLAVRATPSVSNEIKNTGTSCP